MQIGDRVYWTVDDEEGTVVCLNDSAIAIDWDLTGVEQFPASNPLHSGLRVGSNDE